MPLIYDLDSEVYEKYQRLYEALEELKKSEKIWLIETRSESDGAKYNAGATQLLNRKPIMVSTDLPRYVKSNVEPPAIPVGRQTLHFLPDILLICDGTSFGAVSYGDMDIGIAQRRFVEQDEVPSDATVVGATWTYVNKSGEPDRRFKNNRELPVVLYEEVHITSATGLNEVLQASRLGVGPRIKAAIMDLGQFMGKESKTSLNEPMGVSEQSVVRTEAARQTVRNILSSLGGGRRR